MLVVHFDAIPSFRAVTALLICVSTLTTSVCAQKLNQLGGLGDRWGTSETRSAREFYRANGPVFSAQDSPQVVEVRIVGSETYTDSQVRSHIQIRPGRPYDSEQVQSDVRRLMSSGMFHDVRTFNEENNRGISVTFQVFERPTIQEIKYLGNKKIKDRTLRKESGLEVGESLNLYTVRESQKNLEKFYREKGFPKAKVEVVEGNRSHDRKVVFVINEGQLQRVLKAEFVGNQFVSERRLRTKIETKRGYLWFIKGRFDREKLDEDVDKLTAYYRNFGFFRARIGREFDVNKSGKWVSVRFVIDEGPRYMVRNVSLVGVTKFEQHELSQRLELKKGDYFHLGKLNKDVGKLKDFYGHYGYIFANIQAEPRFLEDPGQLDLVFDVKEGKIVRVRNINVQIAGENPHTSKETVWPRLDMRPGEVLSSRKVRNAERRLKAAQIFRHDPINGVYPRVVVRPVDEKVDPPYEVRGQSPEQWVDRSAPGPSYVSQAAVGNHGSSPGKADLQNALTPGNTNHRRFGWPASGQQRPMSAYPISNGAAVAPQHAPQVPYLGRNIGSVNSAQTPAPDNTLNTTSQLRNLPPLNSPSSSTQPVPRYALGSTNQSGLAPAAYAEGPYLQSGANPPLGNRYSQALPPPPPPLTLPSLGPEPSTLADVDVMLEETQTGRFMFGVGVNSDAGVIGNVVVDERNFDLFRPPRSWQDFASGRVFRGGGQGFRLEALPGSRVQRYTISLTEPYLFGTQISSNISGYFFDRRFFDWDEQRFGGRLGFGYRLSPDLSLAVNGRAEQVEIRNPRKVGAAPQLDAVIGEHDLFSARISLSHDTRDVAFSPTEGHLFELSYEQVVGSFDYPRGAVDYRQYFLINQRPDGSGRHTLGFSFRVGVSGADTPVFENFFAGGFFYASRI